MRGTPLRAEREVASDRDLRLGAGAYALVPFTFAAGEAALEVEAFCSAPAAIELSCCRRSTALPQRARGAWRRRWRHGGGGGVGDERWRGAWQTAAREVDDDDVLRRWGHMSPAELIARYRAEDDAAARGGARRCVPPPAGQELRAERRATGGLPPDLKPAANGVGAAPIALMGAAPVVITGIAQNGGGRGGGRGGGGRGGGRGRGGGGSFSEA